MIHKIESDFHGLGYKLTVRGAGWRGKLYAIDFAGVWSIVEMAGISPSVASSDQRARAMADQIWEKLGQTDVTGG